MKPLLLPCAPSDINVPWTSCPFGIVTLHSQTQKSRLKCNEHVRTCGDRIITADYQSPDVLEQE
jgi:hypothetical protein